MGIWHLISFFFIYAFFGWAVETTYFFVRQKKFVKRGFLYGPFCPIYALGMLTVVGLLAPYRLHPLLLAGIGALNASLLELATGFLMDKIFKIKWWDYSQEKFNIGGYVCLRNSFYWFVLSLVAFYFIHPFFDRLVDDLSLFRWYRSLLLFLSVITLVDAVFTSLGLLGFLGKILKIEALKRSINLCDHGHPLTDKEIAEAVYKDTRERIEAQINALLHKPGLYFRKVMAAYPAASENLNRLKKIKKP